MACMQTKSHGWCMSNEATYRDIIVVSTQQQQGYLLKQTGKQAKEKSSAPKATTTGQLLHNKQLLRATTQPRQKTTREAVTSAISPPTNNLTLLSVSPHISETRLSRATPVSNYPFNNTIKNQSSNQDKYQVPTSTTSFRTHHQLG